MSSLVIPRALHTFVRKGPENDQRLRDLHTWRATHMPRAVQAWEEWEAAYKAVPHGTPIPQAVFDLRDRAYAIERSYNVTLEQ